MGFMNFKKFGKYLKTGTGNMFHHPRLFFPFFMLAVLEGGALSLWYYAPRPPVSLLMAPLVRRFGEIYLHYPSNFLLLPRLMFLSRTLIFLIFGGMALSMSAAAVFQVEKERVQPRLFGNFNRAVRRFFPVFFLCLLAGAGMALVYKLPRIAVIHLFLANPRFVFFYRAAAICGFIGMVLVEVFLIFAPVYLVIFRKSFWGALKSSFTLAVKFFLPLVLFVAIMRAADFIINVYKVHLPAIIDAHFPLFPEFVLWYLALDIAVFFIINSFIVTVCFGLAIGCEKEKNGS